MINATAIEINLKLLLPTYHLSKYAAKVMGWRWRKGGAAEWRSLGRHPGARNISDRHASDMQ